MAIDIDGQMNDFFEGKMIVGVQNIVDCMLGGAFIRTIYFVTSEGKVIPHNVKGNVRPLCWAVDDPETGGRYYVNTAAKAKVLTILDGFSACANRWFHAKTANFGYTIWLPLDPSHFEVVRDVRSYLSELLSRFECERYVSGARESATV